MPFPARAIVVPFLAGCLVSIGLAADDQGDAFSREAIPQKWIERLAPERLPELSYAAYYNDLDKARQQAFHGHYRESLISLAKIHPKKKEDQVTVALWKSYAQRAVGQIDQAIATVSDEKIADEPAIQVRRAELLAASGKTADAIALLQE